jgi:hypothetical protein
LNAKKTQVLLCCPEAEKSSPCFVPSQKPKAQQKADREQEEKKEKHNPWLMFRERGCGGFDIEVRVVGWWQKQRRCYSCRYLDVELCREKAPISLLVQQPRFLLFLLIIISTLPGQYDGRLATIHARDRSDVNKNQKSEKRNASSQNQKQPAPVFPRNATQNHRLSEKKNRETGKPEGGAGKLRVSFCFVLLSLPPARARVVVRCRHN